MIVLREITKSFGGVQLFRNIGWKAESSEIVGVVGPNGAGKTTLLDIVAGAQRADAGRVILDGNDVTRLPPHRRHRLGLARTFQTPRPFGDMSVYETALLAGDDAESALRRTRLLDRADEPASRLRLLDRKRLELARALASRPKIVLLDEIAGGLTDAETDSLLELITGLGRDGVTVVWVEHVIRALRPTATRMICLAEGGVLAEGSPAEVLSSPAVRAAYLGRAAL
ncbi:ATP-binding cassette domain-containing protein [Actinoplanes sp. NPDC051851]|uniref:ABC transporter ATP-binding protein n=1 Tax=Actinoplanes sp. NPDC051851 TaxID=3154753 RepID=UPI0034439018